MEILNRRASHEYFILDEYECGLVLTGTEIKSIRNGSVNIGDSYAYIRKNEIYVLNMFIGEYKEGNIFNHNEKRTRKLLMHKSEILKLQNKTNIEGYTVIPLKVYFKNNKAKLLLGVCKGKKNFDKRESLKEKDIQREIQKRTKL